MVIAAHSHVDWEPVETLDDTEREPGDSVIPEKNKNNKVNKNNRMFKQLIYLISFLSLVAVLPAGATETEKDQRKFDYFFYEGLNLKNAGKFDAAYDAFNHCLEIDSTAAPVLYELSSFYVQLNRPEKAVEMLKRAVANSKDNFTYKMALASITRNLGMYGEAAEEYEELVRDYPEKEELNYYLADALTQAGEIGKAIEAYDALESVMGMNEAISMQKYKLYVQLEKPEEAFKEIEKLAAKYPMEARYQIVLGDLLENGEMDKALACYQKANEIDPTDPYYIVSMANYYEAKGDKEAAEQQIRSALVNEKLDVETKVNILSRYILKLQQTKQGTENANHLFQTLLDATSGGYRLKTDVWRSLDGPRKDRGGEIPVPVGNRDGTG